MQKHVNVTFSVNTNETLRRYNLPFTFPSHSHCCSHQQPKIYFHLFQWEFPFRCTPLLCGMTTVPICSTVCCFKMLEEVMVINRNYYCPLTTNTSVHDIFSNVDIDMPWRTVHVTRWNCWRKRPVLILPTTCQLNCSHFNLRRLCIPLSSLTRYLYVYIFIYKNASSLRERTRSALIIDTE